MTDSIDMTHPASLGETMARQARALAPLLKLAGPRTKLGSLQRDYLARPYAASLGGTMVPVAVTGTDGRAAHVVWPGGQSDWLEWTRLSLRRWPGPAGRDPRPAHLRA